MIQRPIHRDKRSKSRINLESSEIRPPILAMTQLSREIRFALVPPERLNSERPSNSWAGWPKTNLVVPHLVLRCVVEGTPDHSTGFLCDVKTIDQALRGVVTERLIPDCVEPMSAEAMLLIAIQELIARWKIELRIELLELELSPFLRYRCEGSETGKSNMPPTSTIELTQQFEFSAAHRLHCSDMSDEENQNLFGKCNNPAGHGHNYVFEVTVSRGIDSPQSQVIDLDTFETIVKSNIVDRLDHKHLNEDVEYFGNVNPTVENITRAIFEWLDGKFDSAKLESVKVFETPKTWAKYSGVG